MIKTVIIDDEPKSIKILSMMLQEYCPTVELAGSASKADDAVALVHRVRPELVFLDIEIPGGNGFDILDRLRPFEFEVIFVTAFNEYTLRAFRYNALDYLLKPVSIDELLNAVHKASENIKMKTIHTRLENFMQSFGKPGTNGLQKIALSDRNGVVMVALTDIIRCEASRGYTSFVIKNRGKLLCSRNIKEYEDMLPADMFFRLHHSHLVNLNCIRMYYRGRGGHVEMEDGAMVEVAVRRKDELLARLGLSKEE